MVRTSSFPDMLAATVEAIVRDHRWRGMLESKLFVTARELPESKNVNESYLGRVLRLTLLSPAVTEAMLSGRVSPDLELADLLKPFPVEWKKQQTFFERSNNGKPIRREDPIAAPCLVTMPVDEDLSAPRRSISVLLISIFLP
jgi:hypothetical protein